MCIWFLGDLNDLGVNTASQIWESPLEGRYIYEKNIIYFLIGYHEQGFSQELHKQSPIATIILKGYKKQIWNIYETNLKMSSKSMYSSCVNEPVWSPKSFSHGGWFPKVLDCFFYLVVITCFSVLICEMGNLAFLGNWWKKLHSSKLGFHCPSLMYIVVAKKQHKTVSL